MTTTQLSHPPPAAVAVLKEAQIEQQEDTTNTTTAIRPNVSRDTNPDTDPSLDLDEATSLFNKALSALPPNKPIIFTNLLRFHSTPRYPSTIPESVERYLCTTGNNDEAAAAAVKSATDPSSSLSSLSSLNSIISGAEVYWTRYFPVYHQAAIETLGGEDEAKRLQRVLYKGAPLMPLRFAREERVSSRGGKITKGRNEAKGEQQHRESDVFSGDKDDGSSSSSSVAGGRGSREETEEPPPQQQQQRSHRQEVKDNPGYWHALVITRVENWEVVQRISESELYKTLGTFHRDAAVEDDELFVNCPVDGFEMDALT